MEKEMDNLKKSLAQVWNYIADDYLAGCPRNRCRGAEVQEAVYDRVGLAPMTKEDTATWRALTQQEQDALLNEIFPKKSWYL